MSSENRAQYRKLSNYKYQLMRSYIFKTGLEGYLVDNSFIRLDANGELFISKGYAWDGPSGPTIDTLSFMRASLVHDALYQIASKFSGKEDAIPIRKFADDLLYTICRDDGMPRWRARYIYWAVRIFGGKHIKKVDEIIYEVPS